MRFTKTLMYALACLKHLAENFGEYVEVRTMAAAHQIPAAYCQRVLFALARAGIVSSRKGKGFMSNVPLGEVSIQRLTEILDPGTHTREEMGQNGYGVLMEKLESELNSIKVSQLLS